MKTLEDLRSDYLFEKITFDELLAEVYELGRQEGLSEVWDLKMYRLEDDEWEVI